MRRGSRRLAGLGLTAACLMWPRAVAGAMVRGPARTQRAKPAFGGGAIDSARQLRRRVSQRPVAAAAKPQPAPAVAAKEDKDDSGDEKQAAAGRSSRPRSRTGARPRMKCRPKRPATSRRAPARRSPSESSPAPADPAPPGGAAPAGSLSTQSQGKGGMPGGYPGMGNPGDMPGGYPGSSKPGRHAGWLNGPGGYACRLSRYRWAAGRLSGFPGPGGMTTGYPGMVGGGGPTQGAAGGSAFGATAAGRGTGRANPNIGPADIHSPDGAVRSFLFALSIRDKDRLSEATALRSQTEAPTIKVRSCSEKLCLETFPTPSSTTSPRSCRAMCSSARTPSIARASSESSSGGRPPREGFEQDRDRPQREEGVGRDRHQ